MILCVGYLSLPRCWFFLCQNCLHSWHAKLNIGQNACLRCTQVGRASDFQGFGFKHSWAAHILLHQKLPSRNIGGDIVGNPWCCITLHNYNDAASKWKSQVLNSSTVWVVHFPLHQTLPSSLVSDGEIASYLWSVGKYWLWVMTSRGTVGVAARNQN